MKRKIKPKTNESTEFLTKKIDDAVDALNKNEDELSKVLSELIQRDLSEEDRNSIRFIYDAYEKSAEMVKKTMEK